MHWISPGGSVAVGSTVGAGGSDVLGSSDGSGSGSEGAPPWA